MRKFMLLVPRAVVVSVALGGCGKPEPTDTVESLVANPERLKDLREQCRLNHAKMGDALCNKVAEATHKRFMGKGTPYTPPKEPPKF